MRRFLGRWGPPVVPEAGDFTLLNFEAQCDVLLESGPAAISSMMGLFPDRYVARMKGNGIERFVTITTLSEAKTAEQAGADVIIAQGMEARDHRAAFDVRQAEARLIDLFSLLPAVADAVKVPIVAAGGIADGRGMAAALLLGASAVRSPEAKIPSAWADAIGKAAPEDTLLTRILPDVWRAILQPILRALRQRPALRLRRPIPCSAG